MYYKWNKYYHNDEELERLFKQAAQNYHPDYQEEDWEALEDRLAQKQKKKSVVAIMIQNTRFILLGVLTLLLSAGFWINTNYQSIKSRVLLEKQTSPELQIEITSQKEDKDKFLESLSDSTNHH